MGVLSCHPHTCPQSGLPEPNPSVVQKIWGTVKKQNKRLIMISGNRGCQPDARPFLLPHFPWLSLSAPVCSPRVQLVCSSTLLSWWQSWMPHLFDADENVYNHGKLDEAKSRIRKGKCSAQAVMQKSTQSAPKGFKESP